jgi:hypothetical protein
MAAAAGQSGSDGSTPLMRRGYWVRVAAMRQIVDTFLAHCAALGETRVSIVSLGAGFDTMPFTVALAPHRAVAVSYVECDLPDVVARKARVIRREKVLALAGLAEGAVAAAAAGAAGAGVTSGAWPAEVALAAQRLEEKAEAGDGDEEPPNAKGLDFSYALAACDLRDADGTLAAIRGMVEARYGDFI